MTAMALAVHAEATSDQILTDRYVLHRRPLRAGTSPENTSRFCDDVWDLGPALLQVHARRIVVDFTTVPARRRHTAKEICYLLLAGPTPAREKPLTILSVRSFFGHLKRFFAWLDSQGLADTALEELRPEDLERYNVFLHQVVLNRTTRGAARSAVRWFWRHRNNLSADRIVADPKYLRGWSEANPGAENVTERIPEQVMGPLLAWALRFVNDFAPAIINAANAARPHRGEPPRRAFTRNKVRQILDDYLAWHRLHHVPLPGDNGEPNLHRIAAALGVPASRLQPHHHRVTEPAQTLGTDSTLHANGVHRWSGVLVGDTPGVETVSKLSVLLQTACYIVISFLSGMRDSEIKHARRGCIDVHKDASGRAFRWRFRSVAFKGEGDPRGNAATWVVGEPTARAVHVLQQLQPPGNDLLFTRATITGPAMPPNRATITTRTNKDLNIFREWVNNFSGPTSPHRIPDIDGRPWQLKTSQFRRTLAWFIARRPGGSIAGAIQYRHHSIQMFEGYAGTSQSGFRAEVEAEQALQRGEHLLAMIDAHDHQRLTGPSAAEGSRRQQQLGIDTGFLGIVVTDERRLLRLINRNDPGVYPGTYITCVFDKAKALCQRDQDIHPDLAACRPLACRNVALTAANEEAWRAELERLRARTTTKPALPPLLLRQVQQRIHELTTFIRTVATS